MRVRNTKYSFEKDPCFSSAAGKKNVKETRPRDKERRHFICNSSSDRTRSPCELYSRPSAPSTQNDHPRPTSAYIQHSFLQAGGRLHTWGNHSGKQALATSKSTGKETITPSTCKPSILTARSSNLSNLSFLIHPFHSRLCTARERF